MILLLCLVICFVGCKQDVDTVKTSDVLEEKYSCEIPNLEANVFTTKWGNIYTTCKASDFFGTFGFTWGDFVTVRFLDQELVLPVVPNYYYVDTGEAAIIIEKGDDGECQEAISQWLYTWVISHQLTALVQKSPTKTILGTGFQMKVSHFQSQSSSRCMNREDILCKSIR